MSAKPTPIHVTRRVAPLVLAALLWCASSEAQVIQQFPIPWAESIALGPDGAMWFTQDEPKIGRIDATGVVSELPIPTRAYDIAAGSDGNFWLTTAAGIGRLTLSGAFTLFPIAGSAGGTSADRITSGPDGNLWFTRSSAALIGRITTSGVITEFPLSAGSRPRNITAGPDGNIWFTIPDSKIGRITTSGVVTELATPTAHSWPFGIAAGSDGNVWFTASYPGLGWITPSGVITELSLSDVWFLTAGADGNLWAAGLGTLKRISPDGSTSTFSIPAPTLEWGQPLLLDIAQAPDGSIWIASPQSQQIVRFSPPSTVCVANATALCLNNGRFRVTAEWRTRDGSNGQGRAISLTADSGYFWFFDAANVEVVVKVLRGCELNSRFWTFAGGLTDVNVTLTVTDTQTGVIKTYINPLGAPFQPIQDADAFATCP